MLGQDVDITIRSSKNKKKNKNYCAHLRAYPGKRGGGLPMLHVLWAGYKTQITDPQAYDDTDRRN